MQVVFAPCRADDLTPDMEVLPTLITSKTKAVVLISPNNPTGAITPPETIQRIQQLCLDKGQAHARTHPRNDTDPL
jgi:aspartate/methionine/tyrosine aminotransferase